MTSIALPLLRVRARRRRPPPDWWMALFFACGQFAFCAMFTLFLLTGFGPSAANLVMALNAAVQFANQWRCVVSWGSRKPVLRVTLIGLPVQGGAVVLGVMQAAVSAG